MDVSEVHDEQTLRAYLEGLPEDSRFDLALKICADATLNCLPVAANGLVPSGFVGSDEASLAALFAAAAISALAVELPKAEITDASAILHNSAHDSVGKNSGTELVLARPTMAVYAAAASCDAAAATGFETGILSSSIHSAIHFALGAADHEMEGWVLLRSSLDSSGTTVWPPQARRDFLREWKEAKSQLILDDRSWDIWVSWYERALAGRNWHPEAMWEVLKTFTKEEHWQGDPAWINRRFDQVLELYRAEDAEALEDSTPVEFTFDTLARVMRMVGLEATERHLKDPAIVQAFLDDAEEVRDNFQDFADYASDLSGGGNFSGVLHRASGKVLGEFKRIEDMTHIRAERLVMTASELEAFSKDKKARDDLGETLAAMLDTRIEGLKRLCRTHFGPSYVALAPLAQLSLEQVDQHEVIALFDAALDQIRSLPSNQLIALDAEGLAVLQDMQNELVDFRAAIEEATTDDFQQMLEGRFAQSSGSMGLTLIRFFERSSAAANAVGAKADVAIKTKKRLEGLNGIVEAVHQILGGGTP